jgi:pyrroline-5-carboxylate reductase
MTPGEREVITPILMLGAGRLGGALIEGWRRTGAFAPSDLMIRDPHPSPAAEAAARDGARLDPGDADLAQARTVLLAVKPQIWREAAAEVTPWLASNAVIVSVAAGVATPDLSAEFGKRPVARVMPTTAAAIARCTASIFSSDPEAFARAHALFEPLGVVVDLADERLMHAATAVSGSSPAYLYAFVEALEAAGETVGLGREEARRLARATLTGAAALLAETRADPAELRKQVTSPGGTTAAALEVLLGDGGLGPLLQDAVAAATRRSKELGS